MLAFLESVGGLGFAILGAALTAGLCCIGSAKGTGMVGEAAAGLTSEDPDKSTKCLILQVLPGTQGLYGFIVSFLILMNIGIFGGINANIASEVGWLYIVASLPIAIGGLISGIAQGRAAVAGISLLAKRQSEFSKAMVSTTLVEIYALLSFLVSLLSVLAISRLG